MSDDNAETATHWANGEAKNWLIDDDLPQLSPVQPTEASDREQKRDQIIDLIRGNVGTSWSHAANAILDAGYDLTPSPVQGTDDEREDLNTVLQDALRRATRNGVVDTFKLADAILAAGFSRRSPSVATHD